MKKVAYPHFLPLFAVWLKLVEELAKYHGAQVLHARISTGLYLMKVIQLSKR
ncbi:hypothetical protein EC836_107274 [Erwinia sp. JUb26]|nr:hypothetical protein EC836_107274 [Erwinia sp. JUb26]